MKYIDADKLEERVTRLIASARQNDWPIAEDYLRRVIDIITSLQQEQPANMIQWTGSNLQEVVDFAGRSPKLGEWFKSWDEFESYVHSHGDIFKLFAEDGSHFEVPVGAWIVKTPDGYNVPSVARFIHAKQEQPEVDLWKEIHRYFNPNGMELQYDRSKGTTILKPEKLFNFARHFYELGLNAKK